MYLNLNVGIIGHVDSGKTSLAKVLSQIASTAAFDKSKQSQERGITLDLGFSSFKVPLPEHLNEDIDDPDVTELQFTLVDCPGHAALIRTIIGGCQIVDMFLLVIDATKGIQTQTGECIVIGELSCNKMIVILNKIDLIPDEKRESVCEKLTRKLKSVLENTRFYNTPFVCVAANPADEDPVGIDDLLRIMTNYSYVPNRNKDGPFFMAIDHCFNISGKGTILTGTVLQGQVQIKDEVQFPQMNLTRQVKSIQVFREDRHLAKVGDRIGLCVSRFDKNLMERGIICTLNYAVQCYAVVLPVRRIVHYKPHIKSGTKFHMSIGHETCVANVSFFSVNNNEINNFDEFDTKLEYKFCEEFVEDETTKNDQYYALLEFGKLLYTMPNSLIIGSKLDMDVHTSSCRLAFYGNMLLPLENSNYRKTFLSSLKVYKIKRKDGFVDRIVNETEVIVKGMFKKESNSNIFKGLKVTLSTGEFGTIQGHFGQSGKIKVKIDEGLRKETMDSFNSKKRKTDEDSNDSSSRSSSGNVEPIKVILAYKNYMYDRNYKLNQ